MMEDHMLWSWASPIWIVAVTLVVAYLILFGRPVTPRVWLLLAGVALLVLAYVSPIGVLASGYLFSAHMVQHLLLLLVIPLCLLLSIPRGRMESWFARPPLSRIDGSWTGIAISGWIAGVGAMWFWHVPSLCNASTQSHLLGGVRDTTFLLAGLAFWWPIFAPVVRFRLRPLNGITYLFSACLGCTLLGIYITFTTISVCPAFANPVHRLNIMTRLYDMGMTPGVDQHLGGLLMWVPPCTLYVCVIVSLLSRWYGTIEQESIQHEPRIDHVAHSAFQLGVPADRNLGVPADRNLGVPADRNVVT